MKHQSGVISATIIISLLSGFQAGVVADDAWALGNTPEHQLRRNQSQSLTPTTFYMAESESQNSTILPAQKKERKVRSSNDNFFNSLIDMFESSPRNQPQASHTVKVIQPKRSRLENIKKSQQDLKTVDILIPSPGTDRVPTAKQKIGYRLFDRWTGRNRLAWKKKFTESDKREVAVPTVRPTVFSIRRNPTSTTSRRAK